MPVSVPADVFFSYNTLVFPPWVKTKLTETPVTSGDNRTVKCSELTINVSGYLTQADADAMTGAVAGEPLDALMLSIRRKLQVHGKALRYINKGYGADLNINADPLGAAALPAIIPAIRDCQYGPKAGRFTWWPLGGMPDGCHGAGFDWTITTWIAECEQFRIRSGVFLEVSFTVSYDVDEAGLVAITYHGTAQIPMSLRDDNTIERTVDDEIQRIIRPVPIGFMRKHTRQLSTDRATCTFTLTDRQIEVPYPQDVVHIEARHRIRQKPMTSVWDASISGTVRMSPTANKSLAWRRFLNIASNRMSYIRHMARNIQGGVLPNIAGGNPGYLQMGALEFDEDLFKNETRFVIPFKMFGAPLRAIIQTSGLWQPLVQRIGAFEQVPWNAEQARDSLAENAQRFRGLIGAKFNLDDEVIIDVCDGVLDPPALMAPVLDLPPDAQGHGAPGDAQLTREQQALALEELSPTRGHSLSDDSAISAEASWLNWRSTMRRVVDHKQIRHKPLRGTVTTPPPSINPLGALSEILGDKRNPVAGWTNTVDDITQQVASPSFMLEIRGFGVRVGFRVNPPKLISYGGKTPVLAYEDVSETQMGISDTAALMRTDWVLIYIIPGAPATLPMPANPSLLTDGTDAGDAGAGLLNPIAG